MWHNKFDQTCYNLPNWSSTRTRDPSITHKTMKRVQIWNLLENVRDLKNTSIICQFTRCRVQTAIDSKTHNHDSLINNYCWIKVQNNMHTQTSEPPNLSAHCTLHNANHQWSSHYIIRSAHITNSKIQTHKL